MAIAKIMLQKSPKAHRRYILFENFQKSSLFGSVDNCVLETVIVLKWFILL